jgi:4-aminobutyrate aminotransferase-like enzyme
MRSDKTVEALAAARRDLIGRNVRTESGVLIGTDGPYHNVLKIRPPMPFGDEDADALLESLEHALSVVSSTPAR